jgi:hypothetical protein
VVDIIDTHDNFQRQWAKRKAFYKKQNYKIIQTDSTNYDPDASKWCVTHKPTIVKKIVKDLVLQGFKPPSSRSSSDRSVADDTDSEVEQDDNVC